jgi:hypothetical protein
MFNDGCRWKAQLVIMREDQGSVQNVSGSFCMEPERIYKNLEILNRSRLHRQFPGAAKPWKFALPPAWGRLVGVNEMPITGSVHIPASERNPSTSKVDKRRNLS